MKSVSTKVKFSLVGVGLVMSLWAAALEHRSAMPTVAAITRMPDNTTRIRVMGDRCSYSFRIDECDELSWSPDGRWLILGVRKPSGRYDVRAWDTQQPSNQPTNVASNSTWPEWAADSSAITYCTEENDLAVWRVGCDAPTLLGIKASDSDWSMDGERIAYVAANRESGVWICNNDGSTPRQVVKSSSASSVTWDPDGHAVVFSEWSPKTKEFTLSRIEANGQNRVSLGSSDTGAVVWGPSSEWLLTRRSGKHVVIGMKSKQVVVMPTSAESQVSWVSASRLMAINEGRCATIGVNGNKTYSDAYPFEKWLEEGEVVRSASMYYGIVIEGRKAKATDQLPRPKMHQVRISGWVDTVDTMENEFTIKVESSMDAQGNEMVFGHPVSQVVLVTANTRRIEGRKERALRPIDLRQDEKVYLYLNSDCLDDRSPLVVASAVVPTTVVVTRNTTCYKPSRGVSKYNAYGRLSNAPYPSDMVFPVTGKVSWCDTFGASRGGGRRRHEGQDVMAPKMRPLVAVFDGVVTFRMREGKLSGISIHVTGFNGWAASYMHVNNDTPGTDDGMGGAQFAFAPGLKSGSRVRAGQLIGYVGDSGNAEGTAPHLHFQLYSPNGLVNPASAFRAAKHLDRPL